MIQDSEFPRVDCNKIWGTIQYYNINKFCSDEKQIARAENEVLENIKRCHFLEVSDKEFSAGLFWRKENKARQELENANWTL